MIHKILLTALLASACLSVHAEAPSSLRDQLLKEANDRAAKQDELDDDPLSPNWRQPRRPAGTSENYLLEHHQKALAKMPRCVHGQFQPEPILRGFIKTDLQMHHDETLERLREAQKPQGRAKGKGGQRNQSRDRH